MPVNQRNRRGTEILLLQIGPALTTGTLLRFGPIINPMEGSKITMLRRISTAVAAVAVLGSCALPASASTTAAHSNSGSFTVPSASSAVKGWGSYTKINAHRIKVTVCVKQTGNAYAVGAEAVAYSANYKSSGAIAAVVLPESSRSACSTAYLFFTSHLKVHTFIGNGGKIVKTSSVKKIF
jgi:hypothetical protein